MRSAGWVQLQLPGRSLDGGSGTKFGHSQADPGFGRTKGNSFGNADLLGSLAVEEGEQHGAALLGW